MTQDSKLASREETRTLRIHTVFIQEWFVSIVEYDGSETDGEREVNGRVEKDAGTQKYGRFVCLEHFSLYLIALTYHTVSNEFDTEHDQAEGQKRRFDEVCDDDLKDI